MEYYATKAEFTSLYPNARSDAYDRFAWDAQRYIDNATTTLDGVKKLVVAFPTDEDDAETVKRCECALINALDEVDAIRQAATAASSYVSTGSGYVSQGIRSISAGGESITYGADAGAETDEVRAAKSASSLKQFAYSIIESYLRGVQDANGVNLLYGGCYPGVM